MQTLVLCGLILPGLIYYGPTIYEKIINNFKLSSIPTVPASGPLSSYIGAYRFLNHAKDIVQEGYSKYRGAVFKMPMMTQWMIVVSGSNKVDDIGRATDDALSLRRALEEALHTNLTFGPKTLENMSYIDAVRGPLTRNIGGKFQEIQDEITVAFTQHISAHSDQWTKIKAYSTMLDIVCRASNRMLVGLPLCREPDYLALNKQFTLDIVKAGKFLSAFPSFLRPVLAPFTGVANGIGRGMRHLEPLLDEHLMQEAQHGKDWPGKSNDIITWLFEMSKGRQSSIRTITARILFINFAAIHSTSVALTNVLFDLAIHPEYVQPLREEVEAIIREEGWSKITIAKLSKLDSFVRESLRLSPNNAFLMIRKVLNDFTFSDGTTIPAGNFVSIPSDCIHTDPENYANAETFDGFRFDEMRKRDGKGSKYWLVSLDLDYLVFGHGRHACPGRFLAANTLKTALAHILLNYEVKMPDRGGRPRNVWFGRNCLPDPTADVLFKKRV